MSTGVNVHSLTLEMAQAMIDGARRYCTQAEGLAALCAVRPDLAGQVTIPDEVRQEADTISYEHNAWSIVDTMAKDTRACRTAIEQ